MLGLNILKNKFNSVLGRFSADNRAAISVIMGMVIALSVPILVGATDALRWSIAYAHMASASGSACDRMVVTSRNLLHAFRDEDREKLAISAFDLEIFNRYPDAQRRVEIGTRASATAHPTGRVFATLDVDTIFLGVFGIPSLPVTIDDFCEGYPPFPILGEYLTNNDFGYFDPAKHTTTGQWGNQDANGIHQIYFANDIQQFGWYATRDGNHCGIQFGTTWNMHDQGNNPPPSGHTWTIEHRGCGFDWATRQIEFHPGYYEMYYEWQGAGGLGSANWTKIMINNIHHADAFRPYRGGWREVDSVDAWFRFAGARRAWNIRRGLLKVTKYEPVMMLFAPQWRWYTIIHNQGVNIAHFKIRYLGTNFDETIPGFDYTYTIN